MSVVYKIIKAFKSKMTLGIPASANLCAQGKQSRLLAVYPWVNSAQESFCMGSEEFFEGKKTIEFTQK
jgi:hypothetical protein